MQLGPGELSSEEIMAVLISVAKYRLAGSHISSRMALFKHKMVLLLREQQRYASRTMPSLCACQSPGRQDD